MSRRPPRAARPLLALALVTLCGTAAPAGAQLARVQKAELRLAADRTSYAPGSPIRLAAVVDVEPGWHIQAHVPTFDYLIPTVLAVETPEGWSEPEVSYPPPIRYRFDFAEDELDVYEGRVRILVATAAPAGAAPGSFALRARLRYQACDDKQCLPPVEREAELSVELGAQGEAVEAELFAPLEPPEPAEPAGAAPAAAPAGGPAGRSLLGFLLLG
ncbi:MAG TPA: protein-disulfide reductase DsbD domain-containing protein, partial [Thermoanaerobaculia bacterium]|nr:protein-disulfide reductase DsbD domain-containing protein [Thermoanaerobaculia bacterium]